MAKFCDIQEFKRVYEHRVGTQFDNAIYEMEKEEFCTDAIPIPKGATNGEMIQALFPNGAVAVMSYPSNKVGFMTRDGNPDDNYVWYPTSWWNAPYKAEREC